MVSESGIRKGHRNGIRNDIRNGIRKGLSSVSLCFQVFEVHGNPVLSLFWDTISVSFLHSFGVFLDTIPAVFWDTILAPFWNILSARSQCFFGYVVPHVLEMLFGSQFSLLSHAFFDTLFDTFLHAFSGSNVFLQEFIF